MILNYGTYKAMLTNNNTPEAVADELLKTKESIIYDTSGFPPAELRAFKKVMDSRRVRSKDVKF